VESRGNNEETQTTEQVDNDTALKPARDFTTAIPEISLPKAGGALQSIGEKYTLNPATGTGGLSIPIAMAAARAAPQLSLNYDSGQGNGPYGLGWSIGLPEIRRKSDRRLPEYNNEDVFILAGSEDLVRTKSETVGNVQISTYQPRTEGQFTWIRKYEAPFGTWWLTISRENVKRWYGAYPNHLGQVNAVSSQAQVFDPERPEHTFQWLLTEERDDRGNRTRYTYVSEDNENILNLENSENNRLAPQPQKYISRIEYGLLSKKISTEPQWMFTLEFDYRRNIQDANWPTRLDPFSSYRSGFDIRTRRLCHRIRQYTHLHVDGSKDSFLNFETCFEYDENPVATKLISVKHKRFSRNDTQMVSDEFPAVELSYSTARPDTQIRTIDSDQRAGTPVGIKDEYRFVDIEGEALSGILSEQGDNWYYRRNSGNAHFEAPKAIKRPSGWASLNNGAQISAIEGDGTPYLAVYGNLAGYSERIFEDRWGDYQAFPEQPNIDYNDPNIRWLDLNGDGKPEVCLLNDEFITWYENNGLNGIGEATFTPTGKNEYSGPAKIFQSELEAIHTGDMSGDGLSDIILIRNGEISYWPNLGYGRFGRKVIMHAAPHFAKDGAFDPARLRLGDIDGSGTADILYLGDAETAYWINQSGNSFSEKIILNAVPAADQMVDVGLIDLLGNGTSCLVWSSSAPADAHAPWRYLNLMTCRDLAQVDLSEVNSVENSSDEARILALLEEIAKSSDFQADLTEANISLLEKHGAQITKPCKPYLLNRIDNNMGMQTRLSYKPSTYFYLKDRANGEPWVTRLPFPVHVVDRQEIIDFVSGNRYVSRFSYHHGFYDRAEREFRGFGRVDQWDTEGKDLEGDELFNRTPVMTKSWFHTGAFVGEEIISKQFSEEYFQAQHSLPESVLENANVMNARDLREAKRALRGQPLRSEIYSCEAFLEGQEKPKTKGHPYQIVENRFRVKMLQQSGEKNEFGIFQSSPEETLTQVFDATPSDPRIAHELTIETDEFGQVLKSATLAYGRTTSSSVADEQRRTHLLINEATLVNAPFQTQEWHRLGIPETSLSWEYGHGFDLEDSGLVRPKDIQALLLQPTIHIANSRRQLASGDRRLLSTAVQLYRKNDDLDLTATPLDLGRIESMALPCRSYVMTYFPSDIAAMDGKFIDQDFEDSQYIDPLKTGHSGLTNFTTFLQNLPETDNGRSGWWARDNETTLSKDDFYAPIEVRDAWGGISTITMDQYALMPISVVNAEGHTVTADIDYRVMAPSRITDANGNMQLARYDLLGRLIQTAITGKNGEGDQLDSLNSFDPSSTATSWINYSFYKAPGDPAFVHTYSRETHANDLDVGETSRWIEGRIYSDGFGREVQTKAKAAPYEDGTPRWVSSARTLYDNKGNPVKQYEPYYTDVLEYGDGPDIYGVSPTIYYDAMDRPIRTVMPDGTSTRVEFNPWEQKSFDTMDTFDPLTATDYDMPLAGHHNTPSIEYLDSLGRPFQTKVTNYNPLDNTSDDYISRVEMDVQGNVLKTIDAMGQTVLEEWFDRAGRPVKSVSNDAGTSYGLPAIDGQPRIGFLANGHRVEQEYDLLRRPTFLWVTTPSNDHYIREVIIYAENASIPVPNGIGQPWRVFDQCGMVETPGFDFRGIPLATTRHVLAGFTAPTGPDEFTPWDQHDLFSPHHLFGESFTTNAAIDALGRPTSSTAPDGSVQTFAYDDGGGLLKVDLDNLPGATATQAIVTDVRYDAQGRREKILYGNDVETHYSYDPKSFRLTRLHSLRNGNSIQDLNYKYDPLGNILQIDDAAGDIIITNNQMISPKREFAYDSISRLVSATGREHEGQARPDQNTLPDGLTGPGVRDAGGLRNYSERWYFDRIGNITRWEHANPAATHLNWQRDYIYGEIGNNRLTRTELVGGGMTTPTDYNFDSAGNIRSVSDGSITTSRWNVDDQPEEMVLHGNKVSRYNYDGTGERFVKRIETSGGYSVRFYLGGFEIFRDFENDGSIKTRRDSLHLMDGEARILLIETDKNKDAIRDANTPIQRWQLADHLGSSTLELDELGNTISYEEFHAYGTTSWHWTNGSVNQKRYRYTGMERDAESGLQYHSARYYMPWLGRWLSADPLGMVDGPGLWSYARGNPVVQSDRNGQQTHNEPEKGIYHEESGTYTVGKGQGPTWISEHLDELGVENNWREIVELNITKFKNVDNLDDIDDIGYWNLNLNEGETIFVGKRSNGEQKKPPPEKPVTKEIDVMGHTLVAEISGALGGNVTVEILIAAGYEDLNLSAEAGFQWVVGGTLTFSKEGVNFKGKNDVNFVARGQFLWASGEYKIPIWGLNAANDNSLKLKASKKTKEMTHDLTTRQDKLRNALIKAKSKQEGIDLDQKKLFERSMTETNKKDFAVTPSIDKDTLFLDFSGSMSKTLSESFPIPAGPAKALNPAIKYKVSGKIHADLEIKLYWKNARIVSPANDFYLIQPWTKGAAF